MTSSQEPKCTWTCTVSENRRREKGDLTVWNKAWKTHTSPRSIIYRFSLDTAEASTDGGLRLGNVIPDFSCDTTHGHWDSFHEWKKGKVGLRGGVFFLLDVLWWVSLSVLHIFCVVLSRVYVSGRFCSPIPPTSRPCARRKCKSQFLVV